MAKTLATVEAVIGLFPGVRAVMCYEVGALAEALAALGAWIGLQAGVSALVRDQS